MKTTAPTTARIRATGYQPAKLQAKRQREHKGCLAHQRPAEGPALRLPGHGDHRQRRGHKVRGNIRRQRACQLAGLGPLRAKHGHEQPGPGQHQHQHQHDAHGGQQQHHLAHGAAGLIRLRAVQARVECLRHGAADQRGRRLQVAQRQAPEAGGRFASFHRDQLASGAWTLAASPADPA